MIYNIKGCHHQRHPFTYIGFILYGTIGDEALKTSYLSGFPLFLYYLV